MERSRWMARWWPAIKVRRVPDRGAPSFALLRRVGLFTPDHDAGRVDALSANKAVPLHYVQLPRAKTLAPFFRGEGHFEQVLEQVRCRYGLAVAGYVVMPEHIHLLVDEPPKALLSTVLQLLKQRSSRRLKSSAGERFWLPRYYDFNVSSGEKYLEKLRYIHRNPVTRR